MISVAKQIVYVFLTSVVAHGVLAGEVFTAKSGDHRVALMELYTSQGCSSCPPTDKWVSSLAAQGIGPDRLIPIALHVDYWDYIGWKDPFADPAHTSRQREAGARNQLRGIYTPQLVVNGRDFRSRGKIGQIAEAVEAIPSEVDLSLSAQYETQDRLAAELVVETRAGAPGDNQRAYLALVENGLETSIQAGENGGRTLRYDHVVRNLLGPFELDSAGRAQIAQSWRIDETLDKANLELVAFVQDTKSGDVLQALSMPMK